MKYETTNYNRFSKWLNFAHDSGMYLRDLNGNAVLFFWVRVKPIYVTLLQLV